jgi:hypothetical protein
MHVGGDGNSAHRFTGGFQVEILAVVSHLHDDALDVVTLDGVVRDGLDGENLRRPRLVFQWVGGEGVDICEGEGNRYPKKEPPGCACSRGGTIGAEHNEPLL